MDFRKNHSFVELFSSKAREDLVFKNRKGEGKYVAVYVKHVVYYLWEGGWGVVAAILRKVRRFSNGPPPTSSKLFFRIDPPVNFTGCEIAPPPPPDWCEDYEFSSYKSCQSSPFNSIPIDVRYCFVLLALTSPPVMIPYLKMTPKTNKYFESDPPDKSPPPPSQVINDQTLNTHYYFHVCK